MSSDFSLFRFFLYSLTDKICPCLLHANAMQAAGSCSLLVLSPPGLFAIDFPFTAAADERLEFCANPQTERDEPPPFPAASLITPRWLPCPSRSKSGHVPYHC